MLPDRVSNPGPLTYESGKNEVRAIISSLKNEVRAIISSLKNEVRAIISSLKPIAKHRK